MFYHIFEPNYSYVGYRNKFLLTSIILSVHLDTENDTFHELQTSSGAARHRADNKATQSNRTMSGSQI